MYVYSWLKVTTTAQVTTTDSTGNIGNYPYLCGRNPGQHGRTNVSPDIHWGLENKIYQQQK